MRHTITNSTRSAGSIITSSTRSAGSIITGAAAGIAAALMLLVCCALPATAAAQETATLHTSFSPDRLGAPTTIGFSFQVSTPEGAAPPPLVGMDLKMPAGMNYVNTTLGLAICNKGRLLEDGAASCPVNSRLGSGKAYVEVPFGKGAGHELPSITAFMGSPRHENMVILFYVDGRTPVYGQYIFEGEVQPQSGVFGSQLSSSIPEVKSVPGGPNVSIVRAEAKIGPEHLLYNRRVHGKLQHFRPRGIAVPEKCPKGGFPFAATFLFQDGSQAQATSVVPCPKPVIHRHTGRSRQGRGQSGSGHGHHNRARKSSRRGRRPHHG